MKLLEELIQNFLQSISETHQRNVIRKDIEQIQRDHDKRKLLFLLQIEKEVKQSKEIKQQRFDQWLRPFGSYHDPIIIIAIYEDID